MSNDIYIHDDFGNRIPLLDNYGNLSMEVIMLYTEDKLTAADRKAVDAFAATDEMSKEALEGYALTTNSSKTRHQLGQVNAGIQKISGAKAVSTLAPPRNEFEYKKLAAAIALLVVVAGGTYFASQLIGDDEMAHQTTELEKSILKTKSKDTGSPTFTSTDTLKESVQEELGLEDEPTAESTTEIMDVEIAAPEEVVAMDMVETQPEPAIAKNAEVIEIDESEAMEVEEEVEVLAAGYSSPADSDDMNGMIAADKVPSSVGNSNGEFNQVVEEAELAAELNTIQGQRRAEAEATRKEEEKLAVAEMARLEAEMAAREQNRKAKMEDTRMAAEQEVAYQAVEQKRREASAERLARESQESTAKFPGGDLEMYKFIENKKNYTEEMRNQGLRGAIVVSFQVEKDGSVSKAKVESGEAELLREDALRVVNSMPKWEPAKRANGNSVKSARVVVIKYED